MVLIIAKEGLILGRDVDSHETPSLIYLGKKAGNRLER